MKDKRRGEVQESNKGKKRGRKGEERVKPPNSNFWLCHGELVIVIKTIMLSFYLVSRVRRRRLLLRVLFGHKLSNKSPPLAAASTNPLTDGCSNVDVLPLDCSLSADNTAASTQLQLYYVVRQTNKLTNRQTS